MTKNWGSNVIIIVAISALALNLTYFFGFDIGWKKIVAEIKDVVE